MIQNNYTKTVNRVGITTIIWNIILSVAKVVAGILAGSASLISDGVHSASDVFTTIIVMVGAKISNKAPDKEHPFGHERMESVATIILAFLLLITACSIGYEGIMSIIDYAKGNFPKIDYTLIYIALGSAIASIVVKAWMFVYTLRAAKKINSTSLKSDAYHHLTDSLSSIGSTLGIVGLMIGDKWAYLDPIACLIISLFIIKIAIDIAINGINQLVDKSAPESFEKEIRALINQNENVKAIDSLRTRQFGNKYYVEVEIAVDDQLSIKDAHEIADEIHDTIEAKYELVKHCMVHVNPLSNQHTDESI